MANNRMAIVCKKCKVGMAIAKYYPMVKKEDYEPGMLAIGGVESDTNSGWYSNGVDIDKFNDFLIRHKHGYDLSMWGGSQYYLGYESDKKNWRYEI